MPSQKIKTYKSPKDPHAFLYREDVFNYVIHLEDTHSLHRLPKALRHYYVLDTLTDEVNNGGFAQYLTNSSGMTYPYLAESMEGFPCEPFALLILEFIQAVTPHLPEGDPCKACDVEINDHLDTLLSALDDRFYALDKKYKLESLIRKQYKANRTDEPVTIQLIRERESDTCRYFPMDQSILHSLSHQQAFTAYLAFLSEFQTNWTIQVQERTGDGMFRITAIADSYCLDLPEIMVHFDDDRYSFLTHGEVTPAPYPRTWITKFDIVMFTATKDPYSPKDDLRDEYKIVIRPDTFKKGDYKIKHGFSSRFPLASPYRSPYAQVILGYMNLTTKSCDFPAILSCLTELVPAYPTIQSLVHTQIDLYTLQEHNHTLYIRPDQITDLV